MDCFSRLPAIRSVSANSSNFQICINSLQRLTKPSQTPYNRHIAARKEVLRLAAINAFQAGECAKKAIQTCGTAIVQIVKRSNPRVALISTGNQMVHVAKLVLAAVASLVLGLVYPKWSVRVCQRLAVVDQPLGFCSIVAQKALSVVRGVVENKVIFGLGVVGILAYSLKSLFSVVDIDVNPAKVAEYSVAAQALLGVLGVVGVGLAGLGAVKGLEHYRRKQQAAADLAAVHENLKDVPNDSWICVGQHVGRFQSKTAFHVNLLTFNGTKFAVRLKRIKAHEVRALSALEANIANMAVPFSGKEVQLTWNDGTLNHTEEGSIFWLYGTGLNLLNVGFNIPYASIIKIEEKGERPAANPDVTKSIAQVRQCVMFFESDQVVQFTKLNGCLVNERLVRKTEDRLTFEGFEVLYTEIDPTKTFSRQIMEGDSGSKDSDRHFNFSGFDYEQDCPGVPQADASSKDESSAGDLSSDSESDDD